MSRHNEDVGLIAETSVGQAESEHDNLSRRSSHSIETGDGWQLDLLHLPARGELRGVALLAHAMMVDRRSMDRPEGEGFASHLAAAGWEVYLVDLRGHGSSGPRAEDGASWTYDDIVQRDLPAAVEAVRGFHPGVPVILLGHSLSGHASAAAAGCGFYAVPPHAHVLLSSNMWLPHLEPSFWMRCKKGLATWLLAFLSLPLGRFPSRLLGMGPADEPRDYVRDIRRIWTTGRWGSRDGRHDYLSGLAEVPGPVLSLVGRDDRLLAHPVGARNWANCFGPGRVDFRVVGIGTGGLGFDPDHMSLVTDTRSRPMWDEIAEWMGSVSASLSA